MLDYFGASHACIDKLGTKIILCALASSEIVSPPPQKEVSISTTANLRSNYRSLTTINCRTYYSVYYSNIQHVKRRHPTTRYIWNGLDHLSSLIW